MVESTTLNSKGNTMNIFEEATRKKYRYQTGRGLITTEDLWTLPLESTDLSIDTIAQEFDKRISGASGKSRVKKVNTEEELLIKKLAIIDYIIAVKLEEKALRAQVTENVVKREKLLGALAAKEEDELKSMSTKDLKKELKKVSN